VPQITSVTLSASADPAVSGRFHLTAAITSNFGTGVAGGRVVFQDMTTLRVLGWTDAGKPSVTVDGLAPGPHRLRADYTGSNTLLPVVALPSQSPELALDVHARPLLTLSSSDRTIAPGQLVTFTVTVTGSHGAPGGAVTFRDGERVIAAHMPLDRAGAAAFTTSALPEGSRNIVAAYEGDTRYAPATTAIEQTVTGTVAFADPPRM